MPETTFEETFQAEDEAESVVNYRPTSRTFQHKLEK